MNEQDGKIKILDSVRAIATIAVFVFHAGFLFSYPQNSIINPYRLVLFSGTVGVSMFFVLSGFLLFYQMYKKQEPLTKKEVWNYAKKRMLRIFPLYYFSLFIIVLFLRPDILSAPDGLRSILYNLVFLRGIKGPNGGGTIAIDPVYWTLVIEVHFYALLPIFYYIFFKFKNAYPFFALILLGLGYRVTAALLLHNPSMQILRFTPANFDFFAFGMLGAYLYVRRVKWLEYMRKSYFQPLLLLVFILFWRFYDFDFLPTMPYILMPTFFGLILMFCILAFVMNEKTSLSKIFTSPPVLFIAKISFSVYIWHAIVIDKVSRLGFSGVEQFFIDILVTLGVSTITYYLIEAPFLVFKSKRNSQIMPVSGL